MCFRPAHIAVCCGSITSAYGRKLLLNVQEFIANVTAIGNNLSDYSGGHEGAVNSKHRPNVNNIFRLQNSFMEMFQSSKTHSYK